MMIVNICLVIACIVLLIWNEARRSDELLKMQDEFRKDKTDIYKFIFRIQQRIAKWMLPGLLTEDKRGKDSFFVREGRVTRISSTAMEILEIALGCATHGLMTKDLIVQAYPYSTPVRPEQVEDAKGELTRIHQSYSKIYVEGIVGYVNDSLGISYHKDAPPRHIPGYMACDEIFGNGDEVK